MFGSSSGSRKIKFTMAGIGAASVTALVLAGCSSTASDVSGEATTGQQTASATATTGGSPAASASAKAKASASPSAAASAKASAAKAAASSGSSSSSTKKPSSSYNMGGTKNSGSSTSSGKSTSKPSAKPTKKPSYTINPRISISQTKGLKNGQYVTVSGTGFDTSKGIYIAFCVITGGKPAPCGGGADTDGDTNKSEWISSNPPTYGKNLAKPFGHNGSFSVRIKVSEKIGSFDCTNGGCGVATRADHTRSSDRSTDRWVRVTFA